MDRIEKTAQIVLEGNGKTSVSKAMREAGYPKATAKNPQQLTRSKKWEKLMEKFLPDNHLATKHREFLDAPRIVRTFKKGDLETEIEETDSNAVRALDMAYKIKGNYSAEKRDISFSDEDRKVLEDIVDLMK